MKSAMASSSVLEAAELAAGLWWVERGTLPSLESAFVAVGRLVRLAKELE